MIRLIFLICLTTTLAQRFDVNTTLTSFVNDPTSDELTKNSISLKQRIVGYRSTLGKAVDGNINSAFVNRQSWDSITAIDLGAIYDIKEISLYVKNVKTKLMLPFTVAISNRFSMGDRRDDYEKSVKILRNFKFTGVNQHLKLDIEGLRGQYLIFVDQSPFLVKLPEHMPFQINEVVVRGERVADPQPTFKLNYDWDSLPEDLKQWRFAKKLTEGVPEMWSDVAQEMLQLSKNSGCVFGYLERCTGIVSHWGQGKFLATTSWTLINALFTEEIFPKFKKNLVEWLCPQCDGISRNEVVKNKINIIEKKGGDYPYSIDELENFLKQGYSMIIYINFWATRKQYELAKRLNYVIMGRRAVWNRHPLQTNAECKDIPPIDTEFDLIKGSNENILKTGIKIHKRAFDQQQVVDKMDEELRMKFNEKVELPKDVGPTQFKGLNRGPNWDYIVGSYLIARKLLLDNFPYPRFPGTSDYPPTTSDVAQRSTVTVTMTTFASYQLLNTGVGVGRSEAFSYRVLEGSTEGWEFKIGARTDELWHKSSINRLPSISRKYGVKKSGAIAHFATGLIFVQFVGGINHHDGSFKQLKIEFSNVYRAAVFDRRLPDTWAYWLKTLEDTEYPIVELGAEVISQNGLLKQYGHSTKEDLFGVTELLDKWCIIDHNVRGTDWRSSRGEYFSYDIQISAGYGHSGYPLMGHRDWVLNKIAPILKSGSWGHCHEIGHNMQQGSWKLPHTGEVTNNLLCYYNYNETVLSVPTFTFPGVRFFSQQHLRDLERHWASENWPAKMYQLNYYLLFGWKFGKGFWINVIRHLNLVKNEKPDFNHLEYLVYVMSKVIGRDFAPYHTLYNMPMRQMVKDATKGFGDCWMPDKDLTTSVEDKITRIEKEYGRKCSRASFVVEPEVDARKDWLVIRKERVKAAIQETSNMYLAGFIPTSNANQ